MKPKRDWVTSLRLFNSEVFSYWVSSLGLLLCSVLCPTTLKSWEPQICTLRVTKGRAELYTWSHSENRYFEADLWPFNLFHTEKKIKGTCEDRGRNCVWTTEWWPLLLRKKQLRCFQHASTHLSSEFWFLFSQKENITEVPLQQYPPCLLFPAKEGICLFNKSATICFKAKIVLNNLVVFHLAWEPLLGYWRCIFQATIVTYWKFSIAVETFSILI